MNAITDIKKIILGLEDGSYIVINFELCYSGIIHELSELFDNEEFENKLEVMCENMDLYSIDGFQKNEEGEIMITVDNTGLLRNLLQDNGLLLPELEIILTTIINICLIHNKTSINVFNTLIKTNKVFSKIYSVDIVTDSTTIDEIM